jgi:hypothetical protein
VRQDSIGTRQAAAVAIPGVAVGAFGLLAFGTIHAWVIVPIWSHLAGGIPLALLAGVSLAWAFDLAARGRGRQTAVHGLEFGVYMFGTLLPSTAVDAVMRAYGLRLGDTTLGMIGGVALFAVSGLVVGWLVSRQRSVAVVFALAALALMAVSGGPLPVARSARGLWISVGVGCIAAAAGAAIASMRSLVRRRL